MRVVAERFIPPQISAELPDFWHKQVVVDTCRAGKTTGKWQTFDIILIGRRVTIVQDGKTVIDNKEIPGITGGALDSREGQPGPIMLQRSEKGHVAFRNIVATPAGSDI